MLGEVLVVVAVSYLEAAHVSSPAEFPFPENSYAEADTVPGTGIGSGEMTQSTKLVSWGGRGGGIPSETSETSEGGSAEILPVNIGLGFVGRGGTSLPNSEEKPWKECRLSEFDRKGDDKFRKVSSWMVCRDATRFGVRGGGGRGLFWDGSTCALGAGAGGFRSVDLDSDRGLEAELLAEVLPALELEPVTELTEVARDLTSELAALVAGVELVGVSKSSENGILKYFRFGQTYLSATVRIIFWCSAFFI